MNQSFPSSLHAYQQLALNNPYSSAENNIQLLMSEGWTESSRIGNFNDNFSSTCSTCSSAALMRSKLNHKPNRKGIVLKSRANSSVLTSTLRNAPHSRGHIQDSLQTRRISSSLSSGLVTSLQNADGSDGLMSAVNYNIQHPQPHTPASHVSKTKVLFPTKHISKWSQVVNGGTFVHSISNLLEKSNHKLQIKELSPSGQIHFVNMMNRDVNLMQTIELYTSLTPHKFTLAYRLKFNMQNGIFTMSSQPDSQILQQGDVNNQTTRHGWALFQISREKGSENLMFPNKIIEVAILL
ncbi:hypothetical protein C9374_008093 [Naegleria lovaniensis]|uniref:Uncharacterized protein n=1 Tax=Naegleria lovaniensis TaxID=51637 RepID=A0AA88GJ59_NAELO|nr:uncharacterized protein C9374_008093 [Naegleria lovaniensis]KAG2378454.1 hypothetical protein C9374_008093 [Naegleria lovaniensis]